MNSMKSLQHRWEGWTLKPRVLNHQMKIEEMESDAASLCRKEEAARQQAEGTAAALAREQRKVVSPFKAPPHCPPVFLAPSPPTAKSSPPLLPRDRIATRL